MLGTISLSLLQFAATLIGTLTGTGFTLWTMMSNKIDKSIKEVKDRLDKLENKVDGHQDKYVLREEYAEGQRRIESLLERLASSQASSMANVTSRMDAILFNMKEKS